MFSLKDFDWNKEKNLKLIEERGVSFEEIIASISNGNLLDIIKNPRNDKYPYQNAFIVNYKNYVYFVPFVLDKDKYFLKTIIPNRVYNKKYNTN